MDILERLSITFNSDGYIMNSTIDGSIQMKSFLSGNPPLRMALNEDLIVGKAAGTGANWGALVLDDCNFHESASIDDFETDRALTITPPEGTSICHDTIHAVCTVYMHT